MHRQLSFRNIQNIFGPAPLTTLFRRVEIKDTPNFLNL
jgi:hypothetical protein